MAISCEAWPEAEAIADNFSTTEDKRAIDSSTSRKRAASKSRKVTELEELFESTDTTIDEPDVDEEEEEEDEEEEEEEEEDSR